MLRKIVFALFCNFPALNTYNLLRYIRFCFFFHQELLLARDFTLSDEVFLANISYKKHLSYAHKIVKSPNEKCCHAVKFQTEKIPLNMRNEKTSKQ